MVQIHSVLNEPQSWLPKDNVKEDILLLERLAPMVRTHGRIASFSFHMLYIVVHILFNPI